MGSIPPSLHALVNQQLLLRLSQKTKESVIGVLNSRRYRILSSPTADFGVLVECYIRHDV